MRLAAESALAAGAGRVIVNTLDPNLTDHGPPLRPEVIWHRTGWQCDPSSMERSTVVCGCGGGLAVRDALPKLLSASPRLVLDADALNAIANDEMLGKLLAARAQRNRPTVLTPHPLEAARLLGCATAEVQADRLLAAQKLAEIYRALVVLKGAGTVIASPGFLPCINPTGNAALSTAGTGDVLAGWIGGTWSHRTGSLDATERPDSLEVAWQAAASSVYLHGLAAERAGRFPLRAAELIEAMHVESSSRSAGS